MKLDFRQAVFALAVPVLSGCFLEQPQREAVTEQHEVTREDENRVIAEPMDPDSAERRRQALERLNANSERCQIDGEETPTLEELRERGCLVPRDGRTPSGPD